MSILPWKCFYILPKTKIKLILPITSVMLWHIQSCLTENLDFTFLKWYFAWLKSIPLNLVLTYLRQTSTEPSKCEIGFRQYSTVLSKMVSSNYPFVKKWLWGNYGTSLVIPHHDFYKKDINVNPYACVNLFFNEDDEI